MSKIPASVAHACCSPTKALPMLQTCMRSPTIIRSPLKFVRPRELLVPLRTKHGHKRLHEVHAVHLESTFGALKRTKFNANLEKKTPSGQRCDLKGAVEASQVEGEGYTGYMEGLRRQTQVAQCLDEDLSRENVRMRLKILQLKDQVDFYYRRLVQIELLMAQKTRDGGSDGQVQVRKLSEQIQRVISAPRLMDAARQLIRDKF